MGRSGWVRGRAGEGPGGLSGRLPGPVRRAQEDLLLQVAAATLELREAEDHELGGLHRGDADLADDAAEVDRLRGLVSASHFT